MSDHLLFCPVDGAAANRFLPFCGAISPSEHCLFEKETESIVQIALNMNSSFVHNYILKIYE